MNVIDWLLDSDPAIRWQVMRDLTDAPADGGRGRARPGRPRGLGRRSARRPARRWLLGRRRVLARVDVDDVQPPAAARLRRRSDRGVGAASARAGPRQREVGVRRPPLLRRRGRAVHQRPGRRDRRLLRPGRARHRRPPPDRADGRWRLELRAGARARWLDARVVRHDDQRPRGAARVRARDRRRTRDVAAARERGQEYLLERRLLRRLSDGEIGDRKWLHFAFPDRVALQRPARPRSPARRRRRAGRASHRGDRARRVEARRRRPLAARPRPSRRAARWTSASARAQPSRWITLRALRVLRWAGRAEAALSSSSASA